MTRTGSASPRSHSRHPQISERLDIAIGTSKSQLFHARRALQEMLEPEGERRCTTKGMRRPRQPQAPRPPREPAWLLWDRNWSAEATVSPAATR
jgi:hypothetical protein